MSECASDIHVQVKEEFLEAQETAKPPTVELPYGLNAEDYWHFMEDWKMSDQQKVAWLVELAHIIKGFVDWGIGQDSVQTVLAQNFVDSSLPESTQTPDDSGNMLER